MSASQVGHLMVNLHMLACPRRRAPKLLIVSSWSWSCFMLWSWTQATIVFSSLRASFLIAAITSSTVLFVSEPPVFFVRTCVTVCRNIQVIVRPCLPVTLELENMTIPRCVLQQILWVVGPFRLWRLPVQRWPVKRCVCQLSGPIAARQRVHL